jgi:hypothetical protein
MPDGGESSGGKSGVSGAVDLVTKIAAALAGILGLVGYVLVLGAAVLWLQLRQEGLPRVVPVSIAAHEELMVVGAQALAMWIVLLAVLGGLAAWIASGDPDRRRFGYGDALFALTISLATVFALDSSSDWKWWLAAMPLGDAFVLTLVAIAFWPSRDTVAAALIPAGFAVGLGAALAFLGNGNEIASSAGAVVIFGTLVVLTPLLQRWRTGKKNVQTTISQLAKAEKEKPKESPLRKALETEAPDDTPTAIVWLRRIVLGAAVLLVLGIIAVTSQVERHGDFHKAVVELKTGKCATGDYVTTSDDKIVLAQPLYKKVDGAEGEEEDEETRLSLIPTSEIVEVQLFPSTPEKLKLEKVTCPAGVLVEAPAPE